MPCAASRSAFCFTSTDRGASPSSGGTVTRGGSIWSSTIEDDRAGGIEVETEPAMVPAHPGDLLKEDVLPALGLSVSEAARQLGVTRQTLHRILAGSHGVTPEMALRLGRFCGNGPGLWLRMQQAQICGMLNADYGISFEKIPVHRPAA